MNPELTVFKRITAAYLVLLAFNSLLIIFTDYHYYGVLSFLVGLWSIEQILKLNAFNNRICSSWKEFFSVIIAISHYGQEGLLKLRAEKITDMAIKKAISSAQENR